MMKNIDDQVLLMMYLYVLLGEYKNLKTGKLFYFIFSNEGELDDCQVDENVKEVLINNIRRRLTPQAVKCRAGKSLHFFFRIYSILIIFRY